MSETLSSAQQWQFWVDRGGTFTDLVAKAPDGRLVTHKLLSENPEQYKDAAVQGIREILGLAPGAAIPEGAVSAVKMGTTVATNALLERKGERTVFVTTEGFADVLRIGYQNRPRLFDRHIRLPEMLYERVVEVGERLAPQGQALRRAGHDLAGCQAFHPRQHQESAGRAAKEFSSGDGFHGYALFGSN